MWSGCENWCLLLACWCLRIHCSVPKAVHPLGQLVQGNSLLVRAQKRLVRIPWTPQGSQSLLVYDTSKVGTQIGDLKNTRCLVLHRGHTFGPTWYRSVGVCHHENIEESVKQPAIQPAIETTVENVELGSIPNFDCAGDATSLGTRWNKWIRSFKFFLTAVCCNRRLFLCF